MTDADFADDLMLLAIHVKQNLYCTAWNKQREALASSRMHIKKISSSSSYRAGSTDIPDPLSPLLPIVHRPR